MHLHLNRTVAVSAVFILSPMFVKILHSFRGMVNNISVFMYSVPQMAIDTISGEEQNSSFRKHSKISRMRFLTYLKIGFCIFMVGGGWELLTKCGMLIFVQSVGIYNIFLM